MRNFNEKVFFYCQPNQPGAIAYQHAMICLAEGFKALGIEYYSDINYWQINSDNNEHLFLYNPNVTPDDCSIVVVDYEWFMQRRNLPKDLFHAKRKYKTVYFELHESEKRLSFLPEFRKFDFIFRGHYNNQHWYHNNVHPWYFGLSNRILKATEEPLVFENRQNSITFNFRHKKPVHSVRRYCDKVFLPQIQRIMVVDNTFDRKEDQPLSDYDKLHNFQTGGRHFSSYYKRLKEVKACATFGGFFVSPFPRNQNLLISRGLKRFLTELGFRSNCIDQWDSWRFWESLAAGCVTFHVDFQKYGCSLPIMPENWKHYVGVDLNNIPQAVDRLVSEPGILNEISREGRSWAIEHYSPVSTAMRFLEVVSQQKDKN